MSHRNIQFILSLLFIFAAGCASQDTVGAPTQVRPAATPLIAALLPEAAPSRTPESAPVTEETATVAAAVDVAAIATHTPFPTQRPQRGGVRPAEAEVYRAVSIGPEATVEWRPPPLPVPVSIHPDDHYWLLRPLPSGTRNYDLEWFPYGNDVLIAELAPFRVHRGMDFPNPTGTPILAASSGTVIHAGPLRSALDGVNYYGNTVIIQHDWKWRGEDVFTLYAHTLELFVEVGDYVEQGQLIAGVGRSGIVSGPHLHLEVRIGRNSYNHTRNPALWIAPYEGWGTLAGRFIDARGTHIPGGWVSARPLDRAGRTYDRYTYLIEDVNPDDVWQENFVLADLPAGPYEITLIAGERTYKRVMDILPGRTNFLDVATNFIYSPPTATPTATVTPLPGEETGEATEPTAESP